MLTGLWEGFKGVMYVKGLRMVSGPKCGPWKCSLLLLIIVMMAPSSQLLPGNRFCLEGLPEGVLCQTLPDLAEVVNY